tara:strand:- start:59 stop:583 length:525 start_codon:yes stop_codon:yes gene_type:complete
MKHIANKCKSEELDQLLRDDNNNKINLIDILWSDPRLAADTLLKVVKAAKTKPNCTGFSLMEFVPFYSFSNNHKNKNNNDNQHNSNLSNGTHQRNSNLSNEKSTLASLSVNTSNRSSSLGKERNKNFIINPTFSSFSDTDGCEDELSDSLLLEGIDDEDLFTAPTGHSMSCRDF